MKYQILEKDKARYICLVILNEVIQFQHYFPVDLKGDDVYLGIHLNMLKDNGLLTIKNDQFIPTDKGREELQKFYEKYYEYLKMFDIFCAVDLEKGEFAFSSINNINDDDEWFKFLDNERFSDVRVAVADFKGLNPVEIVFMSFLNENRFDCTAEKWQDNLTSDKPWKEIEEICNTAIDVDYLKEGGVLEDVITQGSKIAIELVKLADEANAEPQEETEVVEEVTTTEVVEYVDVVDMPYYPYTYWEPYYDPFYISPIWVAALILF